MPCTGRQQRSNEEAVLRQVEGQDEKRKRASSMSDVSDSGIASPSTSLRPFTKLTSFGYETDLRMLGPYGKGDLPQPRWNDSIVAQLLGAVEELDVPAESLEKEDWEKIGARMSPPRSGRSCSRKMKGLKKLSDTKSSEGSAAKESEHAPTTPASDTPPEPSTYETPVSVADQPFSAEDDLELLRLHDAKPGGWYKWLSRQMTPKRHKKEVKERLDYLLSACKNDELEQGSSSNNNRHTLSTPPAAEKPSAFLLLDHDLHRPLSKRARLAPDALSPDVVEAVETSREVSMDQVIQQGVLASVGELSSLESEPAKESSAPPSERNDVAMEVELVAEPLRVNLNQSNDLKLDSTANVDRSPGGLSPSNPTNFTSVSSITSMRDVSIQTASLNFISRPSTIAEPKGTFEEALWALEELSKPLWGPL
ncbi:hypothetical protein BCR35DRAFT_316496 [Leucosporidium creatinivorum]|uniref:Uncharacterized protein n=1 Tax=Leucosporidium creatinivorum TaxID=106004 RepID=A0A1Y2BZC2_9BASI|nr:hypothetical protein BCR35DRAFT_316496 [Leucosporidium creatinivorum]